MKEVLDQVEEEYHTKAFLYKSNKPRYGKFVEDMANLLKTWRTMFFRKKILSKHSV